MLLVGREGFWLNCFAVGGMMCERRFMIVIITDSRLIEGFSFAKGFFRRGWSNGGR